MSDSKMVADYLRRYNAWRRGDDERTMEEAGIVPPELGQMIDAAVGSLERCPAMSRIALRKIEQMGGTPCGVLVRKDDRLASVDEHGRVRWLDGQAARAQGVPNEHGKNRYGLDMAYFRNLFIRELNRPLTDFRPDELARVLARAARAADKAVLQEPEFQAARAQGDAEPIGFIPSSGLDNLNAGHPARVYPVGAAPSPFGSHRLIYTHPQPAQQGSVPESIATDDDVERVAKMAGWDNRKYMTPPDYAEWCRRMREFVRLSVTPQPEGDGWIKCSERLPKLGQRVQLFSQGVIQHMMPLFDDSDEGLFWDFEAHDYNPLVDMSRDQWRPLPQPPQEGEGDE